MTIWHWPNHGRALAFYVIFNNLGIMHYCMPVSETFLFEMRATSWIVHILCIYLLWTNTKIISHIQKCILFSKYHKYGKHWSWTKTTTSPALVWHEPIRAAPIWVASIPPPKKSEIHNKTVKNLPGSPPPKLPYLPSPPGLPSGSFLDFLSIHHTCMRLCFPHCLPRSPTIT